MRIKLELIDDVNNFVRACANYYAGDIYARQGKQTINAKSLLGMYSLNLSESVDIEIETEDNEVKKNFYNYIAKWEVRE